jgi:hypothetical protein
MLEEMTPVLRSAELGVYAVHPWSNFVSPRARLTVKFLVHTVTMRIWPAWRFNRGA